MSESMDFIDFIICKVREHGETCQEIKRWKDFSEESRTFWLPEDMVTRLFRWVYKRKEFKYWFTPTFCRIA